MIVHGEVIDVEWRALNRWRLQLIRNVQRVITVGRVEEVIAEFDRRFMEIAPKDHKLWIPYMRDSNLRSLVGVVGIAALGLYVEHAYYGGTMSLAVAVPVFAWASMITQLIRVLSGVEREVNWCTPAARSFMEALTTEDPVQDVEDPHVLPSDELARIEFRNVSHSYGADLVLQNVSFVLEPGKTVALIGRSGSGKSTLGNLLLRAMDPTSGSILVNGVDLREVQYSSWIRLLGVILQKPLVMDGTIRDNLLFGIFEADRSRFTDEVLWQLLRDLGIDFGKRLKDGLDTRVGHNGLKLSGGEQQRLMIAAAVIRDPKVMLIDEATSSLDAVAQRQVQEGIGRVLSRGMSAVMIAHRLSTILGADMFVVLRPVDELGPGESQIETIAYSVEDLHARSLIFRELAELEGLQIGG